MRLHVLVLTAALASLALAAPAEAREPRRTVFVICIGGDSPLHQGVSVVARSDGRVATNARGLPLERRVYTPAHHQRVALRAALRAGDRFSAVIYYDPLGQSGVSNWWRSNRSARVVVVRDGEQVDEERWRERDSTRVLPELFERAADAFGTDVDLHLVYFGKSLVRPYDAEATGGASVVVDASHPDSAFRLAQFGRELAVAREQHPRLFPLESVIFLACQMTSAEVLTEIAPLARNVVAPQLEISHVAWFGSLRFLERLGRSPAPLTTADVLRAAVEVNRENDARNLELQAKGWEEPAVLQVRRARRRRPSAWVWIRLDRWADVLAELERVVAFVHERFVAPGRFEELHELIERSRVRSRWPRRLVSALDLGQLLIELSALPDRPDAAVLATRLQGTIVSDLHVAPGLRGIGLTPRARLAAEYGELAFNRRTGWQARVAGPYARWLSNAGVGNGAGARLPATGRLPAAAPLPAPARLPADRRLRAALAGGGAGWAELASSVERHARAEREQLSEQLHATPSQGAAAQLLHDHLVAVLSTPRPAEDYVVAVVAAFEAFRLHSASTGADPTSAARHLTRIVRELWRDSHRLHAARYTAVVVQTRPAALLVLQDLKNGFTRVAAEWAEPVPRPVPSQMGKPRPYMERPAGECRGGVYPRPGCSCLPRRAPRAVPNASPQPRAPGRGAARGGFGSGRGARRRSEC